MGCAPGRVPELAKDSAVKARTQAINQLKAVLVIADPALPERMSSLGNAELFPPARASAHPTEGETRTKWPRPPT